MRTLLITGGAGFIGSNLVRYALSHTSNRLVVVDKLTYAGSLLNLEAPLKDPRVTFLEADIADHRAMSRAFAEHHPDAVLNLAAETHVDRSIDGPRLFVDTNIVGTFTLLEVARAFISEAPAGGRNAFRFLHVSTDEVYGSLGREGAFSEETAYAPNSPYAASKAGADHLVRAYAHTYGLPVLITNCSNNYGPYQFPEKLIPHMILNALSGKPLPVYGDGRQIRDWLYVEDHARALWTVLTRGRIGETYNIGGRNEQRNIDVVRTICALLEGSVPASRRYEELITYVTDRPGHDTRYSINAGKIERELGWTPAETFETGLAKTVAWYLENTSWWQRVLDGSYRLARIGTSGTSAVS